MSMFKKLSVGVLGLMMFAGVASASAFRASDIVYLPAVARTPGAGGSFFRTDVVISNVSTERVIVSVAYAPTNTPDNSGVTTSMKTLPVLLPGERRDIVDIVETLGIGAIDPADNVRKANGYLIFFACREGGNCADCDANPADCELITVSGRIYNTASNGGTFGQPFPGIPWYSYASINSADRDLDDVFIPGLRNSGSAGVSGFRSNIGIVNASQFSTTQIRITVFSSTGTSLGSQTFTLGPLGHTQVNATAIASGFTGNGYAVVEQVSVTVTPGQTDANPGFFAYGSLLDNITSDPTTLEAQFKGELPFDCIFGSKPKKRLVRR